MVNDLIGLKHELGSVFREESKSIDCFALFCEARKRMNLYDYYEDFAWVYSEITNGALPLSKIMRQIHHIATRTATPIDGDLAILPSKENVIGLGTVVGNGILTITEKTPSFWGPMIHDAKFWTPVAPCALN
jgi:hypothetical protein